MTATLWLLISTTGHRMRQRDLQKHMFILRQIVILALSMACWRMVLIYNLTENPEQKPHHIITIRVGVVGMIIMAHSIRENG